MAKKAENTETSRRSSGRPRGTDSTREAILVAAREAFGTSGFEAVSLRKIARDAQVDPSTAVHFFGTKEGLFQAVIEDIVPATEPLVAAIRSGAAGEQIARIYLGVWEDPTYGPAIQALLRTAISSQEAIDLLRTALLGVLDSSGAGLGGADSGAVVQGGPSPDDPGVALAMTHLLGVAFGRNVAQLPALTRMSIEELSEMVGPVLDGYFAMSERA